MSRLRRSGAVARKRSAGEAMMGLSTRAPKRETAADRKWPHEFACELDAMPADRMRALVDGAIQRHLPAHELEILKLAEASEREMLQMFVRGTPA
jgi:hypothetical protein